MQAYIFRGKSLNVVDGDTIDVQMDLGFGLSTTQRLRFWGVDTPEKNARNPHERDRAYAAMEFTAQMVEGKDLMIQTYKTDVFGRYLAKVFVPQEDILETTGEISEQTYICLNDLLIQEGFAEVYEGAQSLL
jgi:micrococcal nuclease